MYTSEPGGHYLDHSEIDKGKGTGKDLADDFFEILVENNSVETLEAVLCDGTNVNVGNRTGMLCFLERKLQRNLLWLICQLHGNKLPLKHVFDEWGLQGQTVSMVPWVLLVQQMTSIQNL